ncbi:hypothetical protein JHK82_034171 [Glycine max]|nr:hypothetical protein JHK82_034171 [Glycine max]
MERDMFMLEELMEMLRQHLYVMVYPASTTSGFFMHGVSPLPLARYPMPSAQDHHLHASIMSMQPSSIAISASQSGGIAAARGIRQCHLWDSLRLHCWRNLQGNIAKPTGRTGAKLDTGWRCSKRASLIGGKYAWMDGMLVDGRWMDGMGYVAYPTGGTFGCFMLNQA